MKDNINVDEIINRATKEAIKQFDKEKRLQQRDKRLHNTRLLMKHYNTLKEHIEKVSDDIDSNLGIEDLEDRAWIMSITRTKIRTIKMMAYVDSALKIVKEKKKKSCEEYKYRAFELYYLEEKTNEEIQSLLGCGKNSPKKWSDSVIEELSLLLWGVEALGI